MEYKARNAYRSDDVAKAYDVERFSSLKGKLEDRLEKKAIMKALNSLGAEARILEIPCGTGRITEFLLSHKFKVQGMDISAEMLEVAKNRLQLYENLIGLKQAEAEAISEPSNSFDSIVSVRLFGHIPQQVRPQILKEFVRISRKYVIISYYLPNTIRGFMKRKEAKHGVWHQATKAQIRKEFEDAGLKVVGYFDILPFYSETTVVLGIKK